MTEPPPLRDGSQTSQVLGPGTGVCLAANQTRSSEGAGPVADQISGDVGPTHEQQRGEAKAEATRRRKAAASPPGPPLEKTQKTEALGLETLKTEALGLETLKTEALQPEVLETLEGAMLGAEALEQELETPKRRAARRLGRQTQEQEWPHPVQPPAQQSPKRLNDASLSPAPRAPPIQAEEGLTFPGVCPSSAVPV